MDRPFLGVVGPGTAGEEVAATAEEVGRLVAAAGAVLVCGGLGGVMAAACRGAVAAGATTLGILPGGDRRDANPWVTLPVATGMGELRNGLVVRTSDALVAIGGGYGTLSEVALALRSGRPVVGLGTWGLTTPGGAADAGVQVAVGPQDAVAKALALALARNRAGAPPTG